MNARIPWHACMHRSPTFLIGVGLLFVGWYDFLGKDTVDTCLSWVLAYVLEPKQIPGALMVFGAIVSTIRFLTASPILRRLLRPFWPREDGEAKDDAPDGKAAS